jgi:hypothetical protein
MNLKMAFLFWTVLRGLLQVAIQMMPIQQIRTVAYSLQKQGFHSVHQKIEKNVCTKQFQHVQKFCAAENGWSAVEKLIKKTGEN